MELATVLRAEADATDTLDQYAIRAVRIITTFPRKACWSGRTRSTILNGYYLHPNSYLWWLIVNIERGGWGVRGGVGVTKCL